MAFPLPEVKQWLPDWDGSDSKGLRMNDIRPIAKGLLLEVQSGGEE
jgi:hypothetical protein